ncbi:MAG: isoprenyl transferase [Desulfatitalea sp.]|nr:isoprenyl transferase [Desulfatitalea sp.]NNK02316.1 isoprenyl transferase [Desulfatitalea sp.]
MSSNTSNTHRLNIAELPRHVAVIMDGNGRWAKKRLLNRVKGHEKGAETVRQIVRISREMGIGVLTFFAFSTENWQRPESEIHALMGLFKRLLNSEEREMQENNIRLGIIGQIDRLPEDVRAVIARVLKTTRGNDGMLLNLALSYGGRTEITEMVRRIAFKSAAGTLNPDTIDEATVADHLYTRELPDPDLMIRTSGEMRISNFLLWQLAYAELFVTPTLWPDFTADEFVSILKEYQNRERRFGKVSKSTSD